MSGERRAAPRREDFATQKEFEDAYLDHHLDGIQAPEVPAPARSPAEGEGIPVYGTDGHGNRYVFERISPDEGFVRIEHNDLETPMSPHESPWFTEESGRQFGLTGEHDSLFMYRAREWDALQADPFWNAPSDVLSWRGTTARNLLERYPDGQFVVDRGNLNPDGSASAFAFVRPRAASPRVEPDLARPELPAASHEPLPSRSEAANDPHVDPPPPDPELMAAWGQALSRFGDGGARLGGADRGPSSPSSAGHATSACTTCSSASAGPAGTAATPNVFEFPSAWSSPPPAASAQPARTSDQPLKLIHSRETIRASNRASYDYWSRRPTDEIVRSLRRGEEEPLTVTPDGRVYQGNTRLTILHERGYDIDALPREIHRTARDASAEFEPWASRLSDAEGNPPGDGPQGW